MHSVCGSRHSCRGSIPPSVLLQELMWMVPSGTSPENHLRREGGDGGADGGRPGRAGTPAGTPAWEVPAEAAALAASGRRTQHSKHATICSPASATVAVAGPALHAAIARHHVASMGRGQVWRQVCGGRHVHKDYNIVTAQTAFHWEGTCGIYPEFLHAAGSEWAVCQLVPPWGQACTQCNASLPAGGQSPTGAGVQSIRTLMTLLV